MSTRHASVATGAKFNDGTFQLADQLRIDET
ncbi:unnamed protein product [Mycetohabitans rhizoxinica HKI 454]|uniref:Uncharacterized protein n=1 Tax=Mycetohabitans rhizoxinica (strain DSM 19002 / CIP 109453 / HKI 454) TaxID=882378 RepID=E5APZ1_MYCRK|nr:unnamed protein product [Mycetohabitans rhizoxinica HKI 454]